MTNAQTLSGFFADIVADGTAHVATKSTETNTGLGLNTLVGIMDVPHRLFAKLWSKVETQWSSVVTLVLS